MRAPLAALAALFGAFVASWIVIGQVQNLNEQRSDRDLFLEATSDGWAEASEEFFRSPAAAAELIRTTIERDDQAVSPDFLLSVVQLDPDIDGAYVGYPNGEFVFAARSEDDGFRIRRITGTGDARVTEITALDGQLGVIDTVFDEDDPFDPRQRPWYEPIAEGRDSVWSDPYIFSSSGRPGITHSLGARTGDELASVIGVDVRLATLDRFLAKLRPGPNGTAVLLDANGETIAASDGSPAVETWSLAVPDDAGVVELGSLDGERRYAIRRFGAEGMWTIAAVADDADFITAEDRPLVFALTWLAIAVPLTVLAMLVLRPVGRWFGTIYNRATRDAITGLANRAAITAALAKALEDGRRVTVAIVDLDDFKPVNDTWGHRVGDEALHTVGDRLAEFALDHGMLAGRLGGDEFLVIATGESAIGTEPAWDNLVDAMAVPILVRDHEIRIGASIGVVHVAAGDDQTVERVLSIADRALYGVKRRGGHGWLSELDVTGDPEALGATAPPTTA